MKPATRNGLTALIVILLGVNIAVIVVRYQRDDDRTRVSVAPAPSTTATPTTSVAPSTTVAPSMTVAGSAPPVTSTTPATPSTATVPVQGGPGAGATSTSIVPPTTAPPSATPAPSPEHPHTGGHPLSLFALFLIALGLLGLRFGRRNGSRSNQ